MRDLWWQGIVGGVLRVEAAFFPSALSPCHFDPFCSDATILRVVASAVCSLGSIGHQSRKKDLLLCCTSISWRLESNGSFHVSNVGLNKHVGQSFCQPAFNCYPPWTIVTEIPHFFSVCDIPTMSLVYNSIPDIVGCISMIICQFGVSLSLSVLLVTILLLLLFFFLFSLSLCYYYYWVTIARIGNNSIIIIYSIVLAIYYN